jgi:hypothetical protein
MLLLNPIESFAIFLSKFVLLGQKYISTMPAIEWGTMFSFKYALLVHKDKLTVDANRNTQHLWAPIETLNIFVCKFVLLGMTAAPLAAEFGSLTWYKYSASLS